MPWLEANGLLPGRGAPGGRPTGRGAGAFGRAEPGVSSASGASVSGAAAGAGASVVSAAAGASAPEATEAGVRSAFLCGGIISLLAVVGSFGVRRPAATEGAAGAEG